MWWHLVDVLALVWIKVYWTECQTIIMVALEFGTPWTKLQKQSTRLFGIIWYRFQNICCGQQEYFDMGLGKFGLVHSSCDWYNYRSLHPIVDYRCTGFLSSGAVGAPPLNPCKSQENGSNSLKTAAPSVRNKERERKLFWSRLFCTPSLVEGWHTSRSARHPDQKYVWGDL